MDIAVVVNLRARRGSQRIAQACQRELPDARVMASGSMAEALGFARDLSAKPPSLLVSAGGDGTAVALLNALRSNGGSPRWGQRPHGGSPVGDARGMALGMLPLGTGNGWARAMGAPRWRTGVAQLSSLVERGGSLPLRRFDLVEVDGTIAHFAGTGWDAELIDDFYAQKQGLSVLPRSARDGLPGYLYGMFTRTIPRHVRGGPAEVELVNTGEPAFTVNEGGQVVRLPGGERGAVLYRGPTSVCAAGTTPEWGFGFRAFPFAGAMPRRFCMRVYAAGALEATARMGALWRGKHPVPKMHTWLLTRCEARFSRPVPFQIGGDRTGHREVVEYRLAAEQVDVLDWRGMAAA